MPPFLATLGAKIVAVVAAVLLAFSFGLYKGCAITQQARDAAIAEQAVKSAEVVVKAAENTGKVIVKYDKRVMKEKILAEARAEALQKELDAYVATHPVCPVPDAVVRMFDAPADGVPAAPSPPGGATEAGEAITIVELVQALDEYRSEYSALTIKDNALIEWVRTSYEIQKAGAGR